MSTDPTLDSRAQQSPSFFGRTIVPFLLPISIHPISHPTIFCVFPHFPFEAGKPQTLNPPSLEASPRQKGEGPPGPVHQLRSDLPRQRQLGYLITAYPDQLSISRWFHGISDWLTVLAAGRSVCRRTLETSMERFI